MFSMFRIVSQALSGAGKENRTPDSTLGRSRLTTKLYPREVRRLVYGVLAILTIVQPALVMAQTTETPVVIPANAVHFDVGHTETLTLPDGAKLGVFPNAFSEASDIVWAVADAPLPTVPTGYVALGSTYRLQVVGPTAFGTATRPLAVALPLAKPTRSLWERSIWLYSPATSAWTKLTSSANAAGTLMTASPKVLDGYLVILENRNLQIGIGSWYCKNHCSARYPKYHGTSNDYPVGSLVKVTNPVNNAAVVIKIASKWGQPAGRVVDLSFAAFSALRATNDGLTKVTVQPAPGATLGPVGGAVAVTPSISATEILKKFTISADGVTAPKVKASGYVVYDQNNGTVLASSNADVVRPIASITKLMTAMVFLDRKPSLNKVMAYSSKDAAECSCLRVKPGETMKLSDVLNVMLVGSANNTANMLARSTGLTRAQFVAAMNAKAKAIGLTKTKFADPSGLLAGNVSTPTELATMASYAFHNYSEIRTITTKKSYVFSTINTKQKHTIILRYSLVGTSSISGMTATGSKTGFTNEAGQTYAFRARNAQGAHVIVTILNAPSSAQRNADVAALLKWAFQHHTWS